SKAAGIYYTCLQHLGVLSTPEVLARPSRNLTRLTYSGNQTLPCIAPEPVVRSSSTFKGDEPSAGGKPCWQSALLITRESIALIPVDVLPAAAKDFRTYGKTKTCLA
ncbi:hypothetical protein CRM22_001005, partial [Opisthorchis felineus]